MANTKDNIVSELFWLNMATDNIRNSIDRGIAGSVRLRATIEWAFTIFATSGFMIGIFKDVTAFPVETLWLLGMAFSVLVFAYALSGIAQYPIKQSYNPNDTVEISKVFSLSVKRQSNYLQAASALTLFSFLLIAISVLLLFNGKNNRQKQELCQLTLNSKIENDTDSSYNIPLTANTYPNQVIQVQVNGSNGNDPFLEYKKLLSSPYITDSEGRVSVSLKVPNGYKKYLIHLSINSKSGDTVIKKEISVALSKP